MTTDSDEARTTSSDGIRIIYPAQEEWLGQRLDRVLAALLPDVSRTRAQSAIKAGNVRVNDRSVRPSYLLEAGDRIAIGDIAASERVAHPERAAPAPEAIPLDVVYEDEHLLVVNKPAGLVVHPAPGHASGTLVNALLAHAPELDSGEDVSRPGIVHRLDKDTSGLMVVAKDPAAHAALADQMKEHSTVKRYLAMVEGRMPVPEGVVEAPIGRDPRQRQRMALVPVERGGREARTRFRVLREHRGRSLLELQLETGRTHQIRVHLASVGHPVVGDAVYGGQQAPLPRRQFLHSAHLEFEHPITHEWLSFDAPLPVDLASFLDSWV